ncbi:MAG: leucine-rich repeat protein [Clostridia bacterium]|nr:leucine-rich repeat protein [Clostridia bacterium]
MYAGKTMKACMALLLMLCCLLPLCCTAEGAETAEEFFTISALDETACRITGYTGDAAEVVIPEKIGGYTVREIGDRAFSNQKLITGVTMPDTVEVIGSYAFSGCEALELNRLPASVKTVGSHAFYGCAAITEFTVHAGMERIGNNAFQRTSLERLVIEESETPVQLEGAAFGYLSTLKDVTMPDDVNITSQNSVFVGCSDIALTVTCHSGVIKGRYLMHGGYEDTAVTSVVFEEGITEISDSAFQDVRALASVTLPESLETLGSFAFYDCNALESIVIPSQITTIGRYALAYNENLKTVTLPAGLETIEEYAFSGCAALELNSLPASVKMVGNHAFYGCAAITEFTVHAGMERIGSNAFQRTSLERLVVEESETPVQLEGAAFGYLSTLKDVTMPDDVNITSQNSVFVGCSDIALTVTCHSGVIKGRYLMHGGYEDTAVTSVVFEEGLTEISDSAFQDVRALASVTLPESLEVLGSHAFYNCNALESIVIPSKITTIGQRALADNENLKTVTLPAGLVTIEEYAFFGCEALELNSLPASVKTVGSHAFYGCAAITEFTVHAGMERIGGNAFQRTSLERLVVEESETPVQLESAAFGYLSTLKDVTMPDDVNITSQNSVFVGCSDIALTVTCHSGVIKGRYLMHGSYADTAVTSVVFEEGITEISDSAFQDVRALSSVTLPESLEVLGSHVFYNCDALESIVIPDKITVIGRYALADNEKLRTVTLPAGLVTIEEFAFSGCDTLELNSLPASVKTVGNHAFYGCAVIAEFTVHAGMERIGSNAFQGTSLERLVVEESETPVQLESRAFGHLSTLKEVTMPDDVNITSSDSLFTGCSDIALTVTCHSGAITGRYLMNGSYADTAVTSVVFEEGITEISDSAFYDTRALTSVKLPESLEVLGSYAFRNCDALESIVIPDKITVIGNSALSDNEKLRTVTLPDGLLTIEGYAFSGCDTLELSSLPASVKTVGGSAFYGCTAITEFTVHAGMERIGYSAFQRTSLEKLTVEASDTPVTLEGAVFAHLSTLKEVTMPDDVNITSSDSLFTGCSDIALTVTCHSGAITGRYLMNGSYADTAVTSVVFEEGITEIGDSAFRESRALRSITLPGTLRRIGGHAFASCQKISSLTLPAGLEQIGDYAFSSCGSLIRIALPDGLKAVAGSAFSGCTGLISVTLPDSLETIGSYAFSRCTSLESIEIPYSVTEIGSNAFNDCTALASVEIAGAAATLGENVFWDCTSLRRVTLNDDVKIESSNSVFYRCSDIELTIEVGDGVIGNRFLRASHYTDTAISSLMISPGVIEIGEYAFWDCDALMTVELPATVENIGSHAFSGCAKMMSVRMMMEGEMNVAEDAFGDLPLATFYIKPNEILEAYLSGQDYPYVYYSEDAANGVFAFPDDADPAEYAGMKLQLTGQNGAALITCVVSEEQREYTFRGLRPGEMYGLRLTDGYGFVLADAAPQVFVSGQNMLTLSALPALVDMRAQVLAPSGEDVTDQLTLTWQSAAGKQIARGASAPAIPAGEALTLMVTLNEALSYEAVTPEPICVTADESSADVVCTLAAHETVNLGGRVVSAADGEPLSGTRVTVTQRYDSGASRMIAVYTGVDGTFSLETARVPGVLVIARENYLEYRADLLSYADAAADVSLTPIRGITIALDAALTYAHREGETPMVSEDYQNQGLCEYTLYNETKAEPITDFKLSGGSIVIGSGASDGDVVRVTAVSMLDEFPPVSHSVTVSDLETVTLQFPLTGYGRIQFKRAASRNVSDAVMVYDENGVLVKKLAVRGGEASTGGMPAGCYTLLAMGAQNSFVGINNLSTLFSLGLEEGVDYVSLQAQIHNGSVTDCSVEEIPASVRGRIERIDSDRTVYASNKASAPLGAFFALRAQTALKAEYAAAQDMAWEFVIPGNMAYYRNSLSVNGKLSAYTLSGNTLRVSVSSPEELVRLCVLGEKAGTGSVNAFFTFMLDGEFYREPVGEAAFEVTDMEFSLPEETCFESIPISGTTVIHADVEIYDRGALVATTRSKADGKWSVNVPLMNTESYEGHVFRVKVITQDGRTLTSQPKTLWYKHAYTDVRRVRMINTAHTSTSLELYEYEVEFNFGAPASERPVYWYWPKYPLFTFIAEFEAEDQQAVSNVKIHVKTSKDETVVLDAVYHESEDAWVATGEFVSSNLPVNVGVSYDHGMNNMLVYSEEEVESMLATAQKMIAESNIGFTDEVLLDTIGSGNSGDFVEVISYDSGDGTRRSLYLEGSVEKISSEEFDEIMKSANLVEEDSFVSVGYDTTHTAFYLGMEYEAGRTSFMAVRGDNLTRTTLSVTTKAPAAVMKARGKLPEEQLADDLNDIGDFIDDLTDDGTPPGLGDLLRDELNDRTDNYLDQLMKDLQRQIEEARERGVSECILQRMQEKLDMIRKQIARAKAAGAALGLFEKLHKSTSIGWFGDAAMNMGKHLGGAKLNGMKDVLDFHMDCPDNFANNNCISIAPINIPTIDKNCDDDPDDPRPSINPDADPVQDPSGYVYEAVASNRLPGVTASLYQRVTKYDMYEEPYYEDVLWDAQAYSQSNPQRTNVEGAYGWDVPEGLWQVRYEMEGYEDAASEWMAVPPIRTDVNVSLVSYVQPKVEKAVIGHNAVNIVFDKYMDVATLTEETVTVTANGKAISGTLTYPDAEPDPQDENRVYARRVCFEADDAFEGGVSVELMVSEKVRSYAGVAMAQAYTLQGGAKVQPETMTTEETFEIGDGRRAAIAVSVLPAEAAARRKVKVSTAGRFISIDENVLTLDENGRAEVYVNALLPGSAPIVFALEDSELVAECSVIVLQKGESSRIKTPVSSVPAGSHVPEGTELTLSCATKGASIYYTLDGTSPYDSKTRVLYTEPVALKENGTLMACAVKPGLESSELLTVPFVLTAPGEGLLTLPASLKTIEKEAFMDNKAIQRVIVPDGMESIGVRAFKGCVSLRRIDIPDSVTYIRNCAFEECPQLVIYCSMGSYAYDFATSHGISVSLTD